MSPTLIGIVTFGNIGFTRLAVKEIWRTATKPVDIFIVIGKPEDHETIDFCRESLIPYIYHSVNNGFPSSLNDIYDYAWKLKGYDYVIIMGNDVVPYPGAIDGLIEAADTTEFAWIGASQYDVKSLLRDHPEQGKFFEGPNCLFTDFEARPWDVHAGFVRPPGIVKDVKADVHNLCLYKESVMDDIGYIDVSFFPAYFSDNDYCRRGNVAGVKGCNLDQAAYFHFWSRTIHQGSGGSSSRAFQLNEEYYRTKWGGVFDHEQWTAPFNGADHELEPGLRLRGQVGIFDRYDETKIIEHWKGRLAQ